MRPKRRHHDTQAWLLQETFVRLLVDGGVLKAAAIAVRVLQLSEEFPEVEPRYRRATVRQLLARGRWGVAIEFAQHDKALQLEVRPHVPHSDSHPARSQSCWFFVQ